MQLLTALYMSVFLALAMPDLPPDTIADLQLVQGQAQNLTLQSEGVNIFDETTSSNSGNIGATIATFASLYRGLQAWNEWQGGDDYIIQKQYVVQRTDLPSWLAEFSGDVIFWELDYFGHTVQMLTDSRGLILENPTKGKALNVKIKNTMVEGAQRYKAQHPDYKNISQIEYAPKGYPASLDVVDDPYISGRYLYIPVIVDGVNYTWSIPNSGNDQDAFQDMYIWLNGYQNGNGMYLLFGNNNTRVTSQGMTCPPIQSDYSLYFYSNSGTRIGGLWLNTNSHTFTFKLPCQYALKSGYAGQTSYMYVSNYGNSVNCVGVLNNSPIIQTTEPLYVKKINAQKVEDFPSWGAELAGMSISAQELDNIQQTMSEIVPETDSETGIEILPFPEDLPLPEIVPLEPEPNPIPDGPIYPDFEDFPESDPENIPEYDPETDPATEPTEDALPDTETDIPIPETLSVVTGLQNRFPFCIPWDIYNALSNLSAERTVPHWEWTMNIDIPFTEEDFSYTFVLDLGFMSGTVGLFRNLFLLAFILGLAVFSYNKFFGGGA